MNCWFNYTRTRNLDWYGNEVVIEQPMKGKKVLSEEEVTNLYGY